MPSGAKKRKALKKKQQETTGSTTNNKGFNGGNLHGYDEHGSQDERECNTSLSSPGSQGSEEFGTKDPSHILSIGIVKGSAKELSGDADVTQGLRQQNGNAIVVQQGADYQKKVLEKSPISSSENSTHPARNVACQGACGNSITEISLVVDSVKSVASVSKVGSAERVDTLTHSSLVIQKSDDKKANTSVGLEKNNSKVVTLPSSAGDTSKKEGSVARESEVPVSSEDKRLVLPGPPAVRTSWLSCCGLFDAMTGSDR